MIATLAILLTAAVTASPESHESDSGSGIYLAAGGGGVLYTPTGRLVDLGQRLSFGFVGRGEVGYRVGDVRVGAQGTYTLIPAVRFDESVPLTELQYSMIGIMLTGWYDVPTGSALIPYVGGGVGVVLFTASSQGVSVSDTTIGAQAGLGVNVRLSSSVDLQVGYRILARRFSPALEMYHHAEAGVVYRL